MPPLPAHHRTVRSGVTPVAARWRRRGRMVRLAGGAALRLPRVHRHLRAGRSSVLTLEPLAHALRHGTERRCSRRRSGAHRPSRAPAPTGRHGAACRRPAFRDRGRDHRGVRRPYPGAREGGRTSEHRGRCHRLGERAPALPPARHGGRRLRRRGVVDIVPVRAAAVVGATRMFAVIAVPLALPRDEHDFAQGPGHRAAVHGDDRRGRTAAVPVLTCGCPEGTMLTTIHPVVDVVGLFEVEPGLLRNQSGLRVALAADVLGQGYAGILAYVADNTHAIAPAWRGLALNQLARPGDANRRRRWDAGPRTRARAGAPTVPPAQATRLPLSPTPARPADRVRRAHGAPSGPRPQPLARARTDLFPGTGAAGGSDARPASQPRRNNSATRNTAVASSSTIPSTNNVQVARRYPDQVAKGCPRPVEEAQPAGRWWR